MPLLIRYIVLFFVIINSTQALPIETALDTKFNLKKANQQYDQINLKLSVENLNLVDLENAIKTLEELNHKAENCIIDAQKKINNLDELATQNNNLSTPEKQSVDLVYLNKQKKTLSSHQAECRLFSIRTKEAIEAYRTAVSQLVKKVAFTREMSLWTNINKLVQQLPNQHISSLLPIKQTHLLPPIITLVCIIGLSLLLSTLLLIELQKSRLKHRLIKFNYLGLSNLLLLTATLSMGGLILYQFTVLPPDLSSLSLFIPTLLFGYFTALLFTLFIYRLKIIKKYFLLHSLDYDFFYHISMIIITFYAIGLGGSLLSTQLNLNDTVAQLSESLYLLIIIILTLFYIYRFCSKHLHAPFIQHHRKLIYYSTSGWLLICALLGIFGYHLLANHLTFSSLLIFAIVFITTLLSIGVHQCYLALYERLSLRGWILRYIGYKQDQVFVEFLILKVCLQIMIFAIGIYLIGETMDFATYFIESLFIQLLNGIHFADLTIYPVKILSGIILYCLLFLIFRGISTSIIRHHQFEDEEETQVAFASILTYVGFMSALIVGLMIAGFNFTGLAIVAGALSVGIGLGLQSIVNNFVSGLILLIEKPIRPGDRISVDGAEGFVKKISIRSTQITTPSREDIIIPNSELITRRVTNYMYSDKHCMVTCEIGVAYNSDTHLVKDTLLTIANLHDDVVKTGRIKPIVLFKSFADSNLIFHLLCVIKDVNKKQIVKSDLHFAIDEAFRKHNISMAYPHRDIHLSWDEPLGDPLKI